MTSRSFVSARRLPASCDRSSLLSVFAVGECCDVVGTR
jgi:hypothetical protein